MSPRSRFVSCLVAISLSAMGLVVAGTLPASAHGTRTLNYVALGDSYAAGQGAGRYRNDCLQSRNGYPALLDALKKVKLRRNVSCTGATTQNVLATQISALNRGTRLVTVTVGANDLQVAQVATACASGPVPACQAALDAALALLATPPGGVSVLAGRLATTFGSIAAAAPKARILVTGYPYLFETPPPNDPNFTTIVTINRATTTLNATIAGVVAAASDKRVNIKYVGVTRPFAGHGIGSPVPYINATGPDAFHPNAAGYRAYAAALKAALPTAHRPRT